MIHLLSAKLRIALVRGGYFCNASSDRRKDILSNQPRGCSAGFLRDRLLARMN